MHPNYPQLQMVLLCTATSSMSTGSSNRTGATDACKQPTCERERATQALNQLRQRALDVGVAGGSMPVIDVILSQTEQKIATGNWKGAMRSIEFGHQLLNVFLGLPGNRVKSHIPV